MELLAVRIALEVLKAFRLECHFKRPCSEGIRINRSRCEESDGIDQSQTGLLQPWWCRHMHARIFTQTHAPNAVLPNVMCPGHHHVNDATPLRQCIHLTEGVPIPVLPWTTLRCGVIIWPCVLLILSQKPLIIEPLEHDE